MKDNVDDDGNYKINKNLGHILCEFWPLVLYRDEGCDIDNQFSGQD